MKMEIKSNRYLSFLLTLGVVVFTLQLNIGIAQDFEVAPVLLEFKTEPGMTETKKITIRNHATKGQAFLLKVTDFSVDTTGKKAVSTGSTNRSLKDWITIIPSFIELNPNQSIEVEVIMRVPGNNNDTRWGNIVIQATEEQIAQRVDKNLATGIMVTPRISVTVTQSPRSNRKYSAFIYSFNETTKSTAKLRSFKVAIQNTGDKIIKPKVYLTIANIETGEERRLSHQNTTVFPGVVKQLDFQLPDDIIPGSYALAAIMDYGHGKPMEGAQVLIRINE